MGYLVHAYYSISPTRCYKDDLCWSVNLNLKDIEDIISVGSFLEVLVLNHYVLVRKILAGSCELSSVWNSCGLRREMNRDGRSVYFVSPCLLAAVENIILRDVGVGGGVGSKLALSGGWERKVLLEKFGGGLSKTFRIKIRRRIEVEKMMDNENDVWFKYWRG
ncbi:hypothetical protein Tco_1203687 [Tanacetum coccineum]